MRPKFRAYHKFLKKMLIPEKLWLDDGRITAFTAQGEPGNVFQVRIDSEDYGLELMQSTGLFDKNSKEIYEGDIVSDGVHSYEMIWCEGLYGWMYDDTYSGNLFLPSEISGEIIGNIHEKPELIDRYTIHC